MKKSFLCLSFLLCLHIPALADTGTKIVKKHAVRHESPYAESNISNGGWKTSDRFELSYIEGYQEVYDAREPITIYVEGKSDRMDVSIENGFYVSAVIYESAAKTMEKQVLGEYDAGRRVWQVKIGAPSDNSKRYELFVALYCSRTDSPCAATFGQGTQIDKTLPLQVR